MDFMKKGVEVEALVGPFLSEIDSITPITTLGNAELLANSLIHFDGAAGSAPTSGSTMTHRGSGFYGVTLQDVDVDTLAQKMTLVFDHATLTILPVWYVWKQVHPNSWESIFSDTKENLLDVNTQEMNGSDIGAPDPDPEATIWLKRINVWNNDGSEGDNALDIKGHNALYALGTAEAVMIENDDTQPTINIINENRAAIRCESNYASGTGSNPIGAVEIFQNGSNADAKGVLIDTTQEGIYVVTTNGAGLNMEINNGNGININAIDYSAISLLGNIYGISIAGANIGCLISTLSSSDLDCALYIGASNIGRAIDIQSISESDGDLSTIEIVNSGTDTESGTTYHAAESGNNFKFSAPVDKDEFNPKEIAALGSSGDVTLDDNSTNEDLIKEWTMQLTDQIDGITLEKIFEYVMAMVAGKAIYNPITKEMTIYKRNNVDVLFVMKEDGANRLRISG